MCSAIDIANVVCEDQHIFGITIVILHRNFAAELCLCILLGEINDIAVQGFFAFVEMLGEGLNAIIKFEDLFLIVPVVGKGDFQGGT